MRPRALVAALTMAALASGCGTTRIVATDPTARVVADGQTLGRGQVELTRRGFPGSTHIVARTDDGRAGETRIRRQFTLLTLVAGLFTYGVCLVACWEYPDTVLIPLPPPAGPYPPGHPVPPGAAPPPAADPWLQPPPGWQPPADKPGR